ncbi:ABC transporter substrate-binding protein [Shewanella sp. SNU WT4]|uniref:ABC transporter substrate-binding protein n=1 Tax=Shewanella sp. SNU WT4 TaxID=2590015 RepID=UPI0011269816|nr:ABC transporter substrate-binding protein [Shewanella sp. SNU WT4]QDF67020.1 ABC transporter substrate-binding protein [Shewanella sp. SNU WT4]
MTNVSFLKKNLLSCLVLSMFTLSPTIQAEPVAGSHLKVFIPSLPYIYISHAINSALIRPANNDQGWEYDMATSHQQIDDLTYEFTLRRGVKFQDGTPFNADAVISNVNYFLKKPFLFTKIDKVLKSAEKVDDFTVRFYLNEKYGQFLNDVIWLQFYTDAYLQKFGWNGKQTCPNLAEAGPYGLGPYVLTEGFVEGDRQTPQVVLKANPNYWNPEYPKIETVTVYTELDNKKALQMALDNNDKLDIMPIPFSAKGDVHNSPFVKLVSAPSTNNIAIHFNLINGNPKLLQKEVRVALNKAIDQQKLLDKYYEGEGVTKPTLASPYFPGVKDVVTELKPYSEVMPPESIREQLTETLNGIKLKVLTQDRFMFLWKGVSRDLRKVGVELDFEITSSEKVVFEQLLSTRTGNNTQAWDLLVWGDDDWYFNHPWSAFLVYRTHNNWSTIFPDPKLDGYIDDMFKASINTPEFTDVSKNIMHHVYDNAYMLFVPAPNNVFAVNRHVEYSPYKMASIPLWEIELSSQHWSIK